MLTLEEYGQLAELARLEDGNCSAVVRRLLRAEAERRELGKQKVSS
jgi:hypothetical protein